MFKVGRGGTRKGENQVLKQEKHQFRRTDASRRLDPRRTRYPEGP